jgi:hypothetical protein
MLAQSQAKETNMTLPKTEVKPFARHATRLDSAIKAVICTSGVLGKTCLIKDLSTAGARLEFISEAVAEEAEFVLYIPACKIALNCRKVWRRGRILGIQFDQGRPDLAGMLDGLQPALAA